MKLLTKELEAKLPRLGDEEMDNLDLDNAIVHVKFFTPWTMWTWYGIAYDPETRIFFGYVEGFENELGDFSLDELEQVTGPAGLKIERDLHFTPCKLSELRKG